MIKTKVAYLNKTIWVEEEEPSTLQEVVAIVGEDGIIQHTVKNLRYRFKYPRVYKRVSVEVSKLGFPPKLIRTDSSGKDIYQDEFEHLSSFATSSPENLKTLDSLFQQIATQEPLQSSADRVPGGGRLSQGALDAAHRYFAEGPEEVERVVEKIELMVPNFQVSRTGEPVTPEMLARGIQTLNRHVVNQAKLVTANL